MTDQIVHLVLMEETNPDRLTLCGLRDKNPSSDVGDDGSWPVCRACFASSQATYVERLTAAKKWAEAMIEDYTTLDEWAQDQITRLGGPIQ